MTYSKATQLLLSAVRAAGGTDYEVLGGSPATTKLARFRLPNGRPLAVQINNVTPRMWMLAEHEKGAFKALGRWKPYAKGDSRHWHLEGVQEFRKLPAMVQVTVEITDVAGVDKALRTVGDLRLAA